MQSRHKTRSATAQDMSVLDLFTLTKQIRDKEIGNFGTTVMMMEQRYAHYISATLDVKKRICMEVFNNKLQRISELNDKQLALMNQFYQTKIQKMQQKISEQKDTIKRLKRYKRKNKHKNKNKNKSKSSKSKKHKNKRPKLNENETENTLIPVHANGNGNNDGAKDIITDAVMNNNYSQIIHDSSSDHGSTTQPINFSGNCNTDTANNKNIFYSMPAFNIETNNGNNIAPSASISKMTSLPISFNNNINNSDDSTTESDEENENENDSSDNSSDSDNGENGGIKVKSDHKRHKKRHKKRRHKHKKHRHIKKEKGYKYKYRKLDDEKFLAPPAPPRQGETDKTWLWCNHKVQGSDKLCGVKWIRTLKDRENQAQHTCDAAGKLITRKFQSLFRKCLYCDGSKECTRLATIDEIEEFQARLKKAQIVPNSYGGYKKIGAKQTISQLPPTGGRGRGKNPRKKRKRSRSKPKNSKVRSTVSPPQSSVLNNNSNSRAKSVEETGNNSEASDVNMDNKPLQRRSRKRKRVEFERRDTETDVSDSSSVSSTFLEKELKKQKLDRSSLLTESLDTLLMQAMTLMPNLRWDKVNEWCRYCGSRGSEIWVDCVWGQKKLCFKCGEKLKIGALDLGNVSAAMDRESIIEERRLNACSEKDYLIDSIITKQKMQLKVAGAMNIFGTRRSTRIIKQERINLNETSSVTETESESEIETDTNTVYSCEEQKETSQNNRTNNAFDENEYGMNNNKERESSSNVISINNLSVTNTGMMAVNNNNNDIDYSVSNNNMNNTVNAVNTIRENTQFRKQSAYDEDDDILAVD